MGLSYTPKRSSQKVPTRDNHPLCPPGALGLLGVIKSAERWEESRGRERRGSLRESRVGRNIAPKNHRCLAMCEGDVPPLLSPNTSVSLEEKKSRYQYIPLRAARPTLGLFDHHWCLHLIFWLQRLLLLECPHLAPLFWLYASSLAVALASGPKLHPVWPPGSPKSLLQNEVSPISPVTSSACSMCPQVKFTSGGPWHEIKGTTNRIEATGRKWGQKGLQ